jgi:hypothetical protein
MAGVEIFNSPLTFEQPASGGFLDINTKQYVFKVPKEQVDEFVPDNGMLDPNGFGYHDQSRLSIVNGPAYATVSMAFVKSSEFSNSVTATRKEGESEWFLDISYIEYPLERNADYLTKWNYDLYQAKLKTETSFSASIPAWAATATDKSDTINFNPAVANYRWARSYPADFVFDSTKSYTWIKIQDRTKPGVEAYRYPSFVVNGKNPYRKKTLAIAAISSVVPATLIAPAETFGLNSTATRWLYEPNGLYEDGDWWIFEARFTYNPNGWDTDIYNLG